MAEKTLFGGSEHGRTKQKQLGHRGDGSIGIKVRHSPQKSLEKLLNSGKEKTWGGGDYARVVCT